MNYWVLTALKKSASITCASVIQYMNTALEYDYFLNFDRKALKIYSEGNLKNTMWAAIEWRTSQPLFEC